MDDDNDDELSLYDAIIEASRFGDIERLQELFKDYIPSESVVNQKSAGSELTALHMASANGHLETVQFLCEQGASMNTQNAEGNTPLHWASLNGHLDVVKYLIKMGANIMIQNKLGRTPTYEAQRNFKEEVVHVLLESSFIPEAELKSHTQMIHEESEKSS